MKKLISLLLSLTLIFGLIPGVFAAEGDEYLALGDSITAGTGLKAGKPSFPEILAENNGWNLTNLGADGQTSTSLLAQLSTGSYDDEIAAAKFITITLGGNDMMHLLYDMVVKNYNATYDPDIAAEDVVEIMKNSSDPRFFNLALATMAVINGDSANGIPAFADSAEFKASIKTFSADLKGVMAYIRKLNPKVTVVVPTQYNPYQNFTGIFQSVANSIENGCKKLNAAITSVGAEAGYEVVDMFTVFSESTETLCNATSSPVNLDFHPNARGHEVIAEELQKFLESKLVKYLALGDNITTGTGLNEGEPAFPEILTERNGWKTTNKAVNGMTSEDLLAQVTSGELDNAIDNANVITITMGGNDMMFLLYQLVVDSYNALYDPDITTADVILIMNNSEDPRWMDLALVTLNILNGDEASGIPSFPECDAFKASIDAFSANMKGVMDYIRGMNPDATVIVPTQYNPYQNFTGLFEVIASSVNSGAAKLNAAITSGAKANGYVVVDVFTTFKNSDETLCNATANPLNMDFHPNARGHEVIADRIQSVLDNPFVDVPANEFYFEPVLWAVDNGITNGATVTTFNPGGECMRAHVVTFLWRAAGEPEPTTEANPFVDVKESDFFYKAVLWAVENGITNGADATHFNPLGICNRAQVVTFLHRAAGEPAAESETNPFTDVEGGTWYTVPVLWAVENGITNGLTATTFGPNSACNRAQVVTFLYRAQ